MGVEKLCLGEKERLEPAIGILSVSAALLLGLRGAMRKKEAERTPARAMFPVLLVSILSVRRWGRIEPEMSLRDFGLALGRLGGWIPRKSSRPGHVISRIRP